MAGKPCPGYNAPPLSFSAACKAVPFQNNRPAVNDVLKLYMSSRSSPPMPPVAWPARGRRRGGPLLSQMGMAGAAARRPAKNGSRTGASSRSRCRSMQRGLRLGYCVCGEVFRARAGRIQRDPRRPAFKTSSATRVACFGELINGRCQRGKVRSRGAVAYVDKVIEVGCAPDFAYLLENAGWLLVVVGLQGAANAVQADPVAGAFIAEVRAPAAGALLVPSGARPMVLEPVPAICRIPGPPWKAASRAITWSPTMSEQLHAKVVEDRGDPFGNAGHGDAGDAAAGGCARL